MSFLVTDKLHERYLDRVANIMEQATILVRRRAHKRAFSIVAPLLQASRTQLGSVTGEKPCFHWSLFGINGGLSRVFLHAAVFLFVIFSPGYASGFDCAKASTQVESLICRDKELLNLDSVLADEFNLLKQRNAGLVVEQKKWLHEKRDICQTKSCLKAVYGERINALKNADSCPVNENALLGSWKRIKGGWAFEKMQFSIYGSHREFTSWLHNNLEMVGTWKVDKCTIYVIHNTEEVMQFYFKVNKVYQGRLYLFDADSQTELVYEFIQ